jgi:predicted enzyme related to lactoylglutathione lyase
VAHPSAVGGDEWPAEVATVISFREGQVTSMRDYSTREVALATDKRARAARVVGVEPIFTIADVARAVEHYERLGFTTSHHDAYYAFAHRDHLTIHLAQADDAATAMPGSIYIHVNDADRLADDWRKAGVEVTGPADFDYGKREGSHTDPDGNLIRLGSPLRPRDST